MKYARNEYPRPQFRRDLWQPLNGEWEFEFDDKEDGIARGLPAGKTKLKDKINVPFAYQTVASGISKLELHEVMWYKRGFALDDKWKGKNVLLNFLAVDYECNVWINGKFAVSHKYGYTAFSADITKLIQSGENTLVVQAIDRYATTQPRGKQFWLPKTDRC